MKNYFYILLFGLPARNAHRGSMKNYFYTQFFGLSAGKAFRGTQQIYLVSIFGCYFLGRVYALHRGCSKATQQQEILQETLDHFHKTVLLRIRGVTVEGSTS